MKVFSRQTEGLIAINIAAVIFGSAALYGKMDVSPFWIIFVRAVLASFSLFVFGYFRRHIRRPDRKQAWSLIKTGAVLALHWLSFFVSVQIAGVAIATLTFSAFPMFTLVIEALRQRK